MRLPAVDGLRALAASLVLAQHLLGERVHEVFLDHGHRVLGFLAGSLGPSGVELFFVLSGVVLVRRYARSTAPLDVRTYFSRRVQRLYPPYFLAWLLAGLTTFLCTRYTTWFTQSAHLPAFQLREWFEQIGILHFGSYYSVAWWSLTVEILFYLLVPVLVPLLLRLRTRRDALIALGGTVVFALLAPLVASAPMAAIPDAFAKLVVYSPCFAAGLVLAKFDLARPIARALLALGVAILLAAALADDLPASHAGYALIYTGVVSRALAPESATARALGHDRLIWLGERSYSLFLTHASVIVLVFLFGSMVLPRGATFVIATRLAAVPLSLFAAMLVFSYVECRFAHGLTTDRDFWPWRRKAARAEEVERPALAA
jgi:peptidoglycan/LPS O-acetylase OafA/YrhL